MERWIESNLRWLLIAPALVLLVFLVVTPTIFLFTVAFQEWNPADTSASEWIGLANFVSILSDTQFFWNAVKNTAIFIVFGVAIEFALGMSFAVLVDKHIRRLNFVKTILVMPMMLPPIAVAITFRIIYQPQFGAINVMLGYFDIAPVMWTASMEIARPAIILVDVWENTPFVFLLTLAGLAAQPREPLEAAAMDGANGWQKFRDVTWPFLRPLAAIIILFRVIDVSRLFDQVVVLTRGGPANATDTITYFIYRTGLREFEVGRAAAASILMLLATLAFSAWFITRMQREDSPT
jgi:multiple sugar transport system permease protein